MVSIPFYLFPVPILGIVGLHRLILINALAESYSKNADFSFFFFLFSIFKYSYLGFILTPSLFLISRLSCIWRQYLSFPLFVCGGRRRSFSCDIMSSVPARIGRHKQRYEDQFRLVAGCIPYKHKRDVVDDTDFIKSIEVLMISSPKRDDLVFPKGGWEDDETEREAACREALEEAGVIGILDEKPLGEWIFRSKSSQSSCSPKATCKGIMFALEVTEECGAWAEEDSRRRIWLNVEEAFGRCRYEWMQEALEKFRIAMSRDENYPSKEESVRPPTQPDQDLLDDDSSSSDDNSSTQWLDGMVCFSLEPEESLRHKKELPLQADHDFMSTSSCGDSSTLWSDGECDSVKPPTQPEEDFSPGKHISSETCFDNDPNTQWYGSAYSSKTQREESIGPPPLPVQDLSTEHQITSTSCYININKSSAQRFDGSYNMICAPGAN